MANTNNKINKQLLSTLIKEINPEDIKAVSWAAEQTGATKQQTRVCAYCAQSDQNADKIVCTKIDEDKYKLTGQTYAHKAKIKKYGFTWDSTARAWIGDYDAVETFARYGYNMGKIQLKKF